MVLSTLRDHSWRGSLRGRRHDRRGEKGETLIEVLASIMVAGILVVAVMASLLTAVKASALHRKVVTAELVAGNYVEALTAAPYVTCATPADYQSPDGFDLPNGFTIDVASVQLWNDGTNPPTFSDPSTGCSTDAGLQQLTFTVNGSGDDVRTRTVVKRFGGIYSDSFGAAPGEGVRCTVSAAADTSVDEADPTANNGDKTTMDLVGGQVGSRSHALVRFNLVAGTTPCKEGGVLPAGLQVKSAALRLYTWKVTGSPNCATSCGQVLERITSDWDEATNWDHRPTLDTPGTTLFQHGKTTDDHGPRYQTITSPDFTADVAAFYALPSFNRGWAVKMACDPDYAGRTCDPGARFQLRTSEAVDSRQRPVLTLVLGPSNTKAKQIRNVAFGTCASVKDNVTNDGGVLVALRCSGQGWQSWTYTGKNEFQGTNSGRCMETAQLILPGSPARTYACGDKAWQRWTIDGALIRYGVPGSNMCLAVSNGDRTLGTAIVIAGCDASKPEQQWAVLPLIPVPLPQADVRLRNVAGGNCADPDIRNTMTAVSAKAWVQGFPCMGRDRLNQTWTVMATGRMVNATDLSLCLDGTTGATGASVTVDNCHEGSNQQWSYEGGLLRNLNQGRCLQGGTDMLWFKLAVCDSSLPAQQWIIEPASTPATAKLVHLQNTRFGDCAEPNPNANDGSWTWDLPCDGSRDNQTFVKLSNHELRALTKINACLQATGGSGVVNTWTCDQMPSDNVATNTHQQFEITSGNQLKNLNKGLCMQGYGNAAYNYLQTCNALLTDQQWNVEAPGAASPATRQVRSVDTGSCLDQPGNDMVLWPCSGTTRKGQGVIVLSTGEIRQAKDLSLCLDVNDAGGDGARLRWYGCNNSDLQKWIQVPSGAPGQVQLKTKATGGRCLEDALDADLSRMRTCDTNNVKQRWVIEAPTDQRAVRQIRNKSADSCLDFQGNLANGAELILFPCLGGDRPLQSFLKLNNGQFRATSNLDMCLNINGAGEDGKALIIWSCQGGNNDNLSTGANPTRLKVNASGRCEEFDVATNNPRARTCATSDPAAVDRQTWFVEPVGAVMGAAPVQYRSGDGANAWCVDVSTRTSTTFNDGAALQSFPCLGAGRANQSFVAMSNGMIRSTTTAGLCLDSGENNGSGLRLRGCSTSAWNQKWVATADGQLRNLYGTELRKCIQGGADATELTMATCATAVPGQVIKVEALGVVVRAGVNGRIRSAPSDSCLEPDQVPDASNIPKVWTNPCFGSARVQQYYLRLNNGQIRAKNDTTRCLDSNHGFTGENVKVESCHQPAASNPQQLWTLDSSWMRTQATEGTERRCVQLAGDGAYVTQQPCVVADNQQWTFEETS